MDMTSNKDLVEYELMVMSPDKILDKVSSNVSRKKSNKVACIRSDIMLKS
jgi:hypothetical protein